MTLEDFAGWLTRHQARHPSNWWPAADTEAGKVFYGGWWRALRAVPLELAEQASEGLQVAGAPAPGQQLPVILARVKRLAEDSAAAASVAAVDPDEAAARARSAGCPECTRLSRPTGHATRRTLGYLGAREWPMPMWCRCPLGRHLAARSPGLPVLDLQAWPELWGPMDARFSSEPAAVAVRQPAGIVYLPPIGGRGRGARGA